jgi:hypothetical protein
MRETWEIGARRPGGAPANRPRHIGGARGRSEANVTDSESTLQQRGGATSPLIDSDTIVHATRMETVVLLACWWAFAFYAVRKRRLFDPPRI